MSWERPDLEIRQGATLVMFPSRPANYGFFITILARTASRTQASDFDRSYDCISDLEVVWQVPTRGGQ
jgi:hypothetical protein